MSLLSWERGLKYQRHIHSEQENAVAPLVGAWIEISGDSADGGTFTSLLSWERGLKYSTNEYTDLAERRSSRGSVD